MSEDPSTQGENMETTEQPDGGDSQRFTQSEVNSMMADFKRGLKAENETLKQKAARLDEIEDANKTELERMQEALTTAEQRVQLAESSAMRARIQAAHGITDEDAALFLTATDETELTRQAERLSEVSHRERQGNHVPREGTNPSPGGGDMQTFARSLFGSSN